MKNLLEPKVHVLIEKDNNFLFLRRLKTGFYDGYWCLPTGRVEKGESPAQAAKREVLEEVGLVVEPSFLSTVYAKVQNILSNEHKYYEDVGFFFYCRTKNTPKNCEPEKHDQMEWHSLNNLPDTIMPVAKYGIDCYLNKMPFLEFGY